jgi:hypothetical protein
MNYRLYSFVANNYLSPLQCGLQTAHVVSELSRRYPAGSRSDAVYRDWATNDKTIIICGAGNHKGVLDCFVELDRLGDRGLELPTALFREDEQSMNGMATACGVIVPERYWGAIYEDGIDNGLGYERFTYGHCNNDGVLIGIEGYPLHYAEGEFIKHIKGYKLA